MNLSLSHLSTSRFGTRTLHPMTLVAVAGLIFTGLMTTPASADPLVWKANDFEKDQKWFSGSSGITTDEALSPTHSLLLPANGDIHGYQPFAEMPTLQPGESFGSFVFTVWVYHDDPHQAYQQGIRFSKPDNSDESGYSSTNYKTVHWDWTKLTFDFTSQANSNYAAGRTKISRAYIKAYDKRGAYSPYYVDDVSFTYSIIPASTNPKAP